MKKIIFLIIIAILIFAGIYVAKKISGNNKTVKTGTNTIVKENKTNEENKVAENMVEAEENKVEESNVPNTENKEEQAKEIVKNNWGEDDSVYYSYDGIDKDGRYIICVRDKATTKALFWYYVDLESGTFEIE